PTRRSSDLYRNDQVECRRAQHFEGLSVARAHSHSRNVPIASVTMVSGAPTRKSSQKLVVTPEAAAVCTTFRLAIDASTVKLPARVEAIAIISHALSWALS